MSCQSAVYQWATEVTRQLPHLSTPQATVLALGSLGMVLARSCALSAVARWLAAWVGRNEHTVRQQLRECCYATRAQRGAQRQALVVESCFAPLRAWVLRWWEGSQLALALDATQLGQRFVVLAISVVYRGCAMPVAWAVLPAGQKWAGRPAWLRLLRRLRPAIPRAKLVIVLADRGLYARWLLRRIVRLGWHPFLRINSGGTLRPAGRFVSRPLGSFVPQPGTAWQGEGAACKGSQRCLPCTLLARWEEGYQDPGLLLTDLPPGASEAGWDGLRAWLEQGCKITKRAGWPWQRTRLSDPARAARLGLAVAVATLWLLSVGGETDPHSPPSTLLDLTAALGSPQRSRRAPRLRLVSVLRRGWSASTVALLNQRQLPIGRCVPEPWPSAESRAGKQGVEQNVPLVA